MDRTDLAKMIGANIRKCRTGKALSQETLALDSGIHPAYLGQLERGEKCPNIDTLLKISDALEMPVSKILDFERTDETKELSVIRHRVIEALNRLPIYKQKQIVQIIETIVEMFMNTPE